MKHSDVPDVRMAQEIREAPHAVSRQRDALARPVEELAARLRRKPPRVIVTCARGSSAHAATFGKHLFERYLGVPVAAAAPSIASVYGGELKLKDQLFLAISQSGSSADIVAMTEAAQRSGALTVAIVNDIESPLARVSDIVLPMSAGPELSVAATKTFVTTLAALVRLTAAWNGHAALDAAVARLPERLAAASDLDWSVALPALAGAPSLVTIGRGPTLAIAREAALKLKETANLHAEAFSGAEFLHGPVALVSPEYPILMFNPTDEAAAGMERLAADLRGKGTALFATGSQHDENLTVLPPDQPETDAVCLIQSFYMMAVQLAERLGTDVDRPRHLHKVTSTR
ncbi:SIS domain-containing protein [Rhodomicrobium vannielii ATCC 17100]|uniref:SIS domain-containing protein n=1 Tax=Rhodomicrobium vannielii TaxID=1069 RepID=UPI0019194C72|nr:SIS domain-containing protein [Rhodomicrobium vannielii]MBJ7534306.1 SIS domain-containing protein [Rhodomicrobium vannielii ATCC 17100]